MNCVTLVPKEQFMERSDKDRRTSRGLASCLRGESEEYYEAESMFFVFVFVFLLLLLIYSKTLFSYVY